MTKKTNNTGLTENWIEEESTRALQIKAERNFGRTKLDEIGRHYERVPHPTLKNTFILKKKN